MKMSIEQQIQQLGGDRKLLERYLKQKWTVIPVNYLHNRLMGRNHFLELIKRKQFDHDLPNETIEELISYFDNGGQGLGFTFRECNVIFGIANIFTQKGFPNEIECTCRELYRAAGYGSNPGGGLRQATRQILKALGKKRYPFFWTERNDNWKWLTYENLFKIESIASSKYRIKWNEKFMGRLHRNYRLADPDIFRRIRGYKQEIGKNPSKYDIRLYDLLLLENSNLIKRNYLVLATAPMLMDHYIQERKLAYIRKKLEGIYRMYAELGYLSNFYLDRDGARHKQDFLILNKNSYYKLREVYKQ